MMKEEFEQAIGTVVSQEMYDQIEYVYTRVDFFGTKCQLYHFYENYGMGGIERIYVVARQAESNAEEIKSLKYQNLNLKVCINVLRKDHVTLENKMNKIRKLVEEELL